MHKETSAKPEICIHSINQTNFMAAGGQPKL